MIVKSFIFLSCLLGIVGCGVMSDPAPDKSIEDGTAVNAEIFSTVSKINTKSLLVTEENRVFVDAIGNMNIDALTSYRIFETSTSAALFLTDLNDSAQTLASGDLATVEGWIKNIKGTNIDYQTKNLLFYPILQSSDCGLKERVSIKENNATIIVENSRDACDAVLVYHVLMYEVDKSIENIKVVAFDEVAITVANGKK